MEESAEHFCDNSWVQIGANCKIVPQDSRSGRNWFADTSSGTTTAALDEDIKTAALEALVPSELEQHLAMCTTDHVRAGSERNSGLH